MRVSDQNSKTKSTPHQLIAPQLLTRVKSAPVPTTNEYKLSVQASIIPSANHRALKSEAPGTKFNISSLVTSTTISSKPVPRNQFPSLVPRNIVSSKLVSRHPVLRNAECSYRVMHGKSAAESTQKVLSQRHFPHHFSTPTSFSNQFPRNILSEYVSAFKRSKHISMRKKLSRAAPIKNKSLMAGRPEIHRDFMDKSPPIALIPQYFGSSCPQPTEDQIPRVH